MLLDLSAGDQQYIEDCSVCCRPMVFALHTDGEKWDLQVQINSEKSYFGVAIITQIAAKTAANSLSHQGQLRTIKIYIDFCGRISKDESVFLTNGIHCGLE